MVIAICDDDADMRQKIKNMCNQALLSAYDDYEIIQFEDGEQFILYRQKIDIAILDIEMPKKTGIEVKQYLQDINDRTMIIFVTNHDELIFSAFGLQVFGLILKSRLEKEFDDLFQAALQIMNQYVLVDGSIDSREILYIRSERIYSILVLADGSNKLLRISLNELEQKLLRAGFIRVHRAYLINLKWVGQIENKKIFIHGKSIPIAVRRVKEVKEKYEKYCEKNARYC